MSRCYHAAGANPSQLFSKQVARITPLQTIRTRKGILDVTHLVSTPIRSLSCIGIFGVLLISPTHLRANTTALVPIEPSFMTHTYATYNQYAPKVVKDGNGNFVVTWQSQNQDGDGWGIYARRYNESGVPDGPEFKVNTTILGGQMYPDIAINSQGDFVITWQGSIAGSSNYGIFAQRYNATGQPVGSEFLVNTFTSGGQSNPTTAIDANGNFVIAWSSTNQDFANPNSRFGIYAQRYNAAGEKTGTEFKINASANSYHSLPDVAMNDAGQFVVTWQYKEGTNWDIYAKRFSAGGAAQGSQFRVNTFLTNKQLEPKIAMDPLGKFIIIWRSEKQNGSSTWNVYAQRFSSAATKLGSEFLANTYAFKYGTTPDTASTLAYSATINSNGEYAVAWQCPDQSSPGICTQRYRADGGLNEPWFRVTQWFTGANPSQFYDPSIAMGEDGHLVIAWEGRGSWDGSASSNVYAKRYEVSNFNSP